MQPTRYAIERLLARVEQGTTTAKDAAMLRRLLNVDNATALVATDQQPR